MRTYKYKYIFRQIETQIKRKKKSKKINDTNKN